MNARQQVREYKRELILSAATKLFYEKGFQKTTIDDICLVIGVTKRFIYTYFKYKYDIIEHWVDQASFELFDGVEKPLKSQALSPPERLRCFVPVYVRRNIERQKFTAIMLEEERNLTAEKLADIRVRQREFDKSPASLIQSGVESGDFTVPDPKVDSLAISGMAPWVRRWFSDKGRLSADDLAALLSELALNLVGCSTDRSASR